VWSGSFRDLRVGILERKSFSGIWSNCSKLGLLDFETGKNTILYESPCELGWPVRDNSALAVPWHFKKDVGIDWIDVRGSRIRQSSWRQSGVRSSTLHATESGLGLQTNDQTLWWLGKAETPLWNIRAKPYIYRVQCGPASNVFVGTDGQGGRLFAFDQASGEETLNIKPPMGGAGTLTKVPAHDVLVAKFSTKNWVDGRLFILSMKDRRHELACQCRELLGTWEHGAVCTTGAKGERIAVVDVRPTLLL
jgi:hypothetical protein